MSRERLRRPINVPHPRDHHLTDDDDDDDESSYDSQAEEDYDDDDIDPTDSASATAEFQVPPPRQRSRGVPQRNPSRQHSIPRQQRQRYSYTGPPPAVPAPEHIPMSEPSEYWDRGSAYPSQHIYDRRAGYPQSHVGGYAPPVHAPYGGQMVPWQSQQHNPFTPTAQGAGYGYFHEGRHEMAPYQQQGFYGGAGPMNNYSMMAPPHLANMYMSAVPAPPATEIASRPKTPAQEEKPNPEVEKMRMELERLQLERSKQEEAARKAEEEKKIREEAERAFEAKMAAMKVAQEEAKKEIELARIEAERAMRERIEEERKAEAERQRQHEEMKIKAEREARERLEKERLEREQAEKERAEAMAKAERDAKEKYEAALREAELRKKKEADERELLEAQTRAKIEAEQKAAEEARKAAEKKAEEEAARKKLIEEEARQAAIAEMKKKEEEEKKAAEEAKLKEEADRLKYETEARLKLEKEQQEAADAAAAEKARKKEEEELKKKLLEQAKAEALKKAASGDDKEPVKFKDAVGRKYSFPFHLASKWRSMEDLINQAFAHIDGLGPHVREGHYDLEGPEGELILKNIWDTTVQPGWQVTMKMWPQLEDHPTRPRMPPMPPGLSREQQEQWILRQRMMAQQAHLHRHGPRPVPGHMPPPMGARPPPPPGAHFPNFGPPGGHPRPGEGIRIVPDKQPGRERNKKETKKKVASWVLGKQSRPKKKSK